MHMRALALILLAPGFAAAQALFLGLQAGAPLNQLLVSGQPDYEVKTHRYTVGPTVELGLPHRFGFEADLLYKRLEYTYASAPAVAISRWELPLLVRYRFADRRWQPFVSLGGSLNRVAHIEGVNIAELRHRETQGIVAGGGIEWRSGPWRLAPEMRITRWRDRNFGVRDALLRSNLTQAEILVSLSHGRKRLASP